MTQKIRCLRIDDRLIHGQVIVGWLPYLQSQFLVVASEKIAGDPMRQEMMGLSVPSEVTLLFGKPSDMGATTSFNEETLVLVASPKEAQQCLQSGLVPERLIVGGLHARAGREEVREALHLDADDRAALKSIIDSGVIPEFQPTPQNEPIPLTDIL